MREEKQAADGGEERERQPRDEMGFGCFLSCIVLKKGVRSSFVYGQVIVYEKGGEVQALGDPCFQPQCRG